MLSGIYAAALLLAPMQGCPSGEQTYRVGGIFNGIPYDRVMVDWDRNSVRVRSTVDGNWHFPLGPTSAAGDPRLFRKIVEEQILQREVQENC